MKKVVKPSVTYGNSYLDKKRTAPKREESKVDNESNGVMKKFINLDDIPDIDDKPTNNHKGIGNNVNNSSRDVYSMNSEDQFTQNYPGFKELPVYARVNGGGNLSVNTNGNKYGNRDSANDNADVGYYVKSSPKFGPPLQLSPKPRPVSGSINSARSTNNNNSNAAPPLPYELKQMSEVPKLRSPVRNANYNSKFDYDDPPVDDDDDWNNMTPPHSPHKPVVYSSKVNSIVPAKSQNVGGPRAAPSTVGATPPPLPHEVNSSSNNNNKGLTEEEKLYYSRQPRQVSNFKPYTLKEYNISKPKGYVMIESLKPDLNTDELVAKRNNAERIKQFSKNLSSYNKEILTQQKKLPSAAEKHDIEVSKMKFESKNQRAKEFSKNIPKPVVQQPQYHQRRQQRDDGDEEGFQEYDGYDEYKNNDPYGSSGSGKHQGTSAGQSAAFYSQNDEAEMKLQQLTAKHNQSRQQVDSIRRAMGLK